MTAATAQTVQYLNLAYLGRPADPASLIGFPATGMTDEQIVLAFVGTSEYETNTVSPNSTLSASGTRTFNVTNLINTFYKRLFGRYAASSEISGWTNALTSGAVNYDYLGITILRAALNLPKGTEMRETLIAKYDSAAAFTSALDADSAANAAYSTSTAVAQGVSFWESVTGTTPASASAVSSAISALNTASVTGSAFTLTANTDVVTGTANNDTISSSSSTFNSDDTVDGGAGSDTLSVSAAGNATVIANVSNVETIKVTQGGAGGTDYGLNMIGSTGATELVSRLSTGEVSFDNVQSDAKVTAFGVQSGAKVTAGFLNALASGTADSVSLKADGGANATFQVSGTDDTKEFETINLESAGSLKNTVAGIKDSGGNNTSALKTLNVSGSAALDITLAGAAASAAYDGSTATGAQGVTVGGNYTSITTGSGSDKITTAGGFFGNTGPKVIVGGAGTDTLVVDEDIANLTSSNAKVDHSVSGIETVEVVATLADGGTADLTRGYAADKIAGVSKILVTAENNDGTAGGGGGEDVTVNLTGVTTQAIDFSFKASATGTNDEAISVKLKDDTGSADSVTIASVSSAATTAHVNSLSSLTVDRLAGTTANAVETVNLIASAADVSTTVGTTITSLDASYSNTLNLSGAGNITIAAVELADPTGTTTAMFDASALTGNLTLGSGFRACR